MHDIQKYMHNDHELPNLAALDMNQLVVLEALLVEGSVSRAAQRLGRSQSTVSHALARLRDQLDDPLLVRDGMHMRATARAMALRMPLTRALNDIRVLLSEPDGFEPASSSRTFVIASADLFVPLLGPLLAALESEAPGVRVEVRSASDQMLLRTGAVHLQLVVANDPPPPGIEWRGLGSVRWVVFARRGHPISARPSVADWARWPHVQVSRDGERLGPVSEAARRAGIRRQVGMVVPGFLAALPMVAASDALFTTLGAPFAGVAKGLGLRTLRCPVALPKVEIAVAMREAPDPGVRWLCDRVVSTCALRSRRSKGR